MAEHPIHAGASLPGATPRQAPSPGAGAAPVAAADAASFRVELIGPQDETAFDEVVSLVGEDASGSFGLLARHARFLTVLDVGLARLRLREGRWRFVALTGGVLRFDGRLLRISTRHHRVGDDPQALEQALRQESAAEQAALARTLRKLHHLEAEVMLRLARLEEAAA